MLSQREGTDAAARSRTLVLILRLLLLVLAACAAIAAVWIARFRDRAGAESRAPYVCPMHPDVVSAAPGQCPICGMDLERSNASDSASDSVAIDPSTYLNYDIIRLRGTGPDSPAPAWVDRDGDISAVLYKDELERIAPQAKGMFYVSGASPKNGFPVRTVPGSLETWDRSTSRVRFRIDAGVTSATAEPWPAADTVGRVRLIERGSELPVIASSAILEGADGPYVLVGSPDGRTFAKRPVRIGKVFGGLAVVLSGVGPRERILTRSAFFVDAERRLRHQAAIEVER